MTDQERQELEPLARHLRAKRRKDALQIVIDAAVSCALEQDRETPGHEGRLRQREVELCQAIEEAYEAIQEGLLTDEDFMIALAAYEAERE
jgi:hypothetical protein